MKRIATGIIDNGITLHCAVESEPIRRIAVTAAESQYGAADAYIAIVKAIREQKIPLICRSQPDRKSSRKMDICCEKRERRMRGNRDIHGILKCEYSCGA